MRLNRFLASAGLGSRRGVEELIRSGRVKINGRLVTDLATTVEPSDAVKVGSRLIRSDQGFSVLMYKPRGYLCTANDESARERKTIFELFPSTWPRVFHVGRLDMESEGLLVVTNDGDLSLAMTHPRFKIEKEYEVAIDKPMQDSDRVKLLKGFHIIGGRAKMERLDITSPKTIQVTLLQGIKRQVRLMLYEVGYEVTRLCRVRIGPLRLETMKPGEFRLLTPREVANLKGAQAVPRPPRPPIAKAPPRPAKRTRESGPRARR